MEKRISIVTAFFMAFVAAGAVYVDKGFSSPQEDKAQVAATGAGMEADAAETNFQKAHSSFMKNDLKSAASEIREAESEVKKGSENATGKAARDLKSSAADLESLAKKIESGAVTSAKDLEKAFSRSHRALAEYYHQSASEDWAKKDAGKAGHELKAAADHLDNAIAWSGHEANSGTKEVLKGTRDVADKLIEGAGWSAGEVGKAVKDIGHEIRSLG